eukprot:7257839-Lingulodinium_polyedra.AAC.1
MDNCTRGGEGMSPWFTLMVLILMPNSFPLVLVSSSDPVCPWVLTSTSSSPPVSLACSRDTSSRT